MQIYDAVEGIMAILQLNPLLDRTQIISKMERVARWLNARKDAFHSCNSRTSQQLREINKRPARFPSIESTVIRTPLTPTTSLATGILPRKFITKPLTVSQRPSGSSIPVSSIRSSSEIKPSTSKSPVRDSCEISSSSVSYSSRISPISTSTRSSRVTMPSVPPYSSKTIARC
ncbi:hypothetical protein FGO68_gene8663 [Halteria grandinella]|uniref:Uncharacterized protein n=1 Tax=Halteria grandinella TaxID=5974 RepID=A0A8J8N9G6_HALGN|nr:hypothetical protein FGO68_gene8663 [Halteria grandinella]